VAILGPGLIGGSLALALRATDPSLPLRLWGRNPDTLNKATKTVGGDVMGFSSPEETAQGAATIVLCTPMECMENLARKFLPALSSGTLVTDVGSVKAPVVASLEKVLGSSYVGSHPMAGSEQSGWNSASAQLFENSVCFLTPTPHTPKPAVKHFAAFWRSVGCSIQITDPKQHDQAVARISHLPHLTAAALVLAAGGQTQSLAGPGYRDSTRVAMGSPDMWSGIIQHNREAILSSLDLFEQKLGLFRRAVTEEKTEDLQELLAGAAKIRRSLPRKS